MNIKTGDKVIVMAGKDRMKVGKVIKVFPSENRLVIEGVNVSKRREKPRTAGKPGQVIESPSPLQAAKVMIWCSSCRAGRRIGHRIDEKKKVRVCRKCGHEFK